MTKYITTLFATAAALAVAAPANAATISGLFNTGVDNNRNVLVSGSDSHYVLNGNATPALYNNGNYIQAPDATWIAANANGGYTVNPNTYTLTFNLTGFDLSSARISGIFAADNAATVSLNGTLLASTQSFQSFTNFSANSGFVAGNNVLSFVVSDFGAPSALLVSGLTGTANATAAVPEPATWAMMTLGFGAMGFAMRRKKVSTRIRFA